MAAWTHLFPLWQTTVVSMAPSTWTWWQTAWRPSTVQGVSLKCLMVFPSSREPRPSRYFLSQWPTPHLSEVVRCCRGNRPYVCSLRWVCSENHGEKATASKVSRKLVQSVLTTLFVIFLFFIYLIDMFSCLFKFLCFFWGGGLCTNKDWLSSDGGDHVKVPILRNVEMLCFWIMGVLFPTRVACSEQRPHTVHR